MSYRLAFVTLLLVSGCATTASHIPELGPPTRVMHYEHGQLSDDPIEPGSQVEAEFNEWLERNKSGWQTNHYTTIALSETPQVCGDNFRLHCGHSQYVLNYRVPHTQSWRQVTKSVDHDHEGLRFIQGTVKDDD